MYFFLQLSLLLLGIAQISGAPNAQPQHYGPQCRYERVQHPTSYDCKQDQECQTSYDQKCDTTYEDKCDTTYEDKCQTHYEQQCQTTYKNECTTKYEKACETKVNKLYQFVTENHYALMEIFLFLV